jgi:hypothetical protein
VWAVGEKFTETAATQTVKNATCLTIAYTKENSAIHFSTDERN